MPLARDAALWMVWGPLKRLVWRLPPAWTLALGRLLGRAYHRLAGGKRRDMETAARMVLTAAGDAAGQADPATASRLVRQACVNFVRTDLEVLLFPRLTPAMTEALTRLEGREHLDAALAGGKGAVLAFGHFGANQMLMPALGHRGYRLHQLSAPATELNKRLPEARSALVRRTRELRWAHEASLPVTHINIFGSLKPAFACLKRGEPLAVAMDGGGGERKLPARFLGRTALFSVGAPALALRAGAPLLYCAMLRDPATGRHVLRIDAPLPMPPGDPRDEAAVAALLQAMVSRLEADVLARPDHYLYFLAFRLHMAQKEDAFFLEEDAPPQAARRGQ